MTDVIPQTNRIIEEGVVERIRETVAPRINIEWNPEDNTGQVIFQLRDQVWEQGVYLGLQKQTRLRKTGAGDSITADIPDILSADIPFNGTTFSGQLLMGLIKAYFDMLWVQRWTEENTPSPEPEIPEPGTETLLPGPEVIPEDNEIIPGPEDAGT